MHQIIEVAGDGYNLTRFNNRTVNRIEGERERIFHDTHVGHRLIHLDAVNTGLDLESIIVAVAIQANAGVAVLHPVIIVLGSQAITVDVVPVATQVDFLGQAEVAVGLINVGIIVAALKVNVDVVLLVGRVEIELGTVGIPARHTVGCTEQIQVGSFLKVGCQGHRMVRHNERINTVGIGRHGCGDAIIGYSDRVEDEAIGGSGLEGYRLAVVGVILSVKVGIAIDEVKLATISRITYRVNLYRLQEIGRDIDVGCGHREVVIISEVAGSRRGQCRHLVGRKIGHGHRANSPSVSRADKEVHIVILL